MECCRAYFETSGLTLAVVLIPVVDLLRDGVLGGRGYHSMLKDVSVSLDFVCLLA